MRTHVIYLHQNPYLFDSSVTDNIAYGLRRQRLSIKEISSKVSAALDWAGIGHLQLRNARDLSGGECQRVAFARARILSPRVLLLDEPTTNMDSVAREQTYRMIKRLKDDGVSILLVVWRYDLLVRFTHFIGAFWPTSTLFLLGLLFLMLINLHYSVKISGLTNQVKNLSQEITLLKGELTGIAQPPEEESDDG